MAAAVVWAMAPLLPAAVAPVAPLVVEAVPFEALALEVLLLLLQAAQPFVVLAPLLQVGRLLGEVAQLLLAAAVLVGQAGPSAAVAAAWPPAAAPPPAQSDPPTRPTLGAAAVACCAVSPAERRVCRVSGQAAGRPPPPTRTLMFASNPAKLHTAPLGAAAALGEGLACRAVPVGRRL